MSEIYQNSLKIYLAHLNIFLNCTILLQELLKNFKKILYMYKPIRMSSFLVDTDKNIFVC